MFGNDHFIEGASVATMASKGADEIIKEIGGCGRFQIVLGIVMHTIKLSTVWSMFTMVFAAATPKWWCYDDVYGDVMLALNTTDGYLNVSNTNYSANVEPLYKSCTNRNGGACKNIVYDYSMRTIFNEVIIYFACNYRLRKGKFKERLAQFHKLFQFSHI